MQKQFGSALSEEAKANTFITIPGLRGMAAKEISVKNLAGIIQARMNEILDFVSYHLKQVGLDSKMLNGGIILTGGGSQLRHLIQLTEYVTGMNARIGYPNEHLASEFKKELAQSMYSTCIGLILKGCNDYENRNRNLADNFIKVTAEPEPETAKPVEESNTAPEGQDEGAMKPQKVKSRAKLKGFMDSIKNNLIEMFREEEDDAKL